jgi:hypothetical protein
MKQIAAFLFFILPFFCGAQAAFNTRHIQPVAREIKQVPAPALVHSSNTAPVSFRLRDFKVEELPFFCRIEHQWAKQLAVPIKFRLGSVEYVDWLEGK